MLKEIGLFPSPFGVRVLKSFRRWQPSAGRRSFRPLSGFVF